MLQTRSPRFPFRFNANPENRMAFQFLMAHQLLDREPSRPPDPGKS